MNMGDWVRKWSEFSPRKIAIVDHELELTYGELNDRINRVCSYLLKKAVAKGDRVAIISFNSHEFIEIYFASAKTGTVFVPINWRMAPQRNRLHSERLQSEICLFRTGFCRYRSCFKGRSGWYKALRGFRSGRILMVGTI